MARTTTSSTPILDRKDLFQLFQQGQRQDEKGDMTASNAGGRHVQRKGTRSKGEQKRW